MNKLMQLLLFFALIFVNFLTFSCKNEDAIICQYRLENLLVIDTPNTVVTYQNDTIIEVRDKRAATPTGVYAFDENKNLRFYGFFVNEKEYKYSESYDSIGNIIEKDGSPLVEYMVRKENNDTVLFNVFLFSLNKKYEKIEIISNNQDTIRPKFLYKADIYSNMKCFSFKLPVAKNIKNLVLYAKGIIINTCTKDEEPFSDTTSFKEVDF